MSSSPSSGNAGGAWARCSPGIRESSGRSGTSDPGTIAVARPGRLDSNSNEGIWSLYMLASVLSSWIAMRRAGPLVILRVFRSSPKPLGRSLRLAVGVGQAVDLGPGPFLGDGDQDRVGKVGIPAAEGDPA